MNIIALAARAILKRRYYEPEFHPDLESFYASCYPEHVMEAEADARAVIEVMREPVGEAMTHLGNVLQVLAELHADDRCQALDDAMAFYNAANPDSRVEAEDGYETRLVQIGPLHFAMARAAALASPPHKETET